MTTPEELQSLENNAKLRDLGIEWSDRLFKEFMEKEGNKYKAEERALFYMTLGGDLLARMYADVSKEFGAKHGQEVGDQVAQKLLSTGFSLVSLFLRRHGMTVDVGVRANFTKVENSTAKKESPACDHAAAKICKCKRDEDGHCESCLSKFREIFSVIGQTVQMLKANEDVGKDVCLPCAPKNMDAALAKVIREEMTDLDPEMSEAMIQAMFVGSQNLQALPMPLSRKAWSDLQSS